MIIYIILLIIICELTLLFREYQYLRESIKKYYEKTNEFIKQLCDLIDRNSAMEEKILKEISEKLEKRGKE